MLGKLHVKIDTTNNRAFSCENGELCYNIGPSRVCFHLTLYHNLVDSKW